MKGGGPGWRCPAGCCGHPVLGELPDPPSASTLVIRGSRILLSPLDEVEKQATLYVLSGYTLRLDAPV